MSIQEIPGFVPFPRNDGVVQDTYTINILNPVRIPLTATFGKVQEPNFELQLIQNHGGARGIEVLWFSNSNSKIRRLPNKTTGAEWFHIVLDRMDFVTNLGGSYKLLVNWVDLNGGTNSKTITLHVI